MFRFENLVSEDHTTRLPYVRIKSIELINFKSVKHGQINLLGKEITPFNTEANIVGVYGQNGSGKTSLIEALNVVRGLLGGYKLGDSFSRYIDVKSEFANIRTTFEFQYVNGTVGVVEYSVKLTRDNKTDVKKIQTTQKEEPSDVSVAVSEEMIKTNFYPDGHTGKMHLVIDTKDYLYSQESYTRYFFGNNYSSVIDELIYLKRKSREDSQSFVFSPDIAALIQTNKTSSKYIEILAELCMFALHFLFVSSTKSSAIAQLHQGVPIYTPITNFPIFLNDGHPISAEITNLVKSEVKKIDVVISNIIPDMHLELNSIPTRTEDGKEACYLNLLSVRGDQKIPFEYESDGIIKIVSILARFIFAFNQGSATMLVDEFDSGVFEYLLGELLDIFQDYGKGQLIFTSHNLRPLEILDKKSIWFTTTDPENRYCRLKGIGQTNNLRDQYLKAVHMGNTDAEYYKKEKQYKLVNALRDVGRESISYEE